MARHGKESGGRFLFSHTIVADKILDVALRQALYMKEFAMGKDIAHKPFHDFKVVPDAHRTLQ